MGEWVDFEAIKRGAGLAPLLERYRVVLRRGGHGQYRGRCPIHPGESQEAFHANLDRNIFHCFSCGAGGGVLDFVAAMERCSPREAALLLRSLGDMAVSVAPPASQSQRQLVTKKREGCRALGFALRGVDGGHPYLAARGLDRTIIEEFGVGYYSGPGIFSGRVVIPIHNERGELAAYCGRALQGTDPRYRFPPGFAKSEVLFNFHRAAATGKPGVVVVEGFFDCFRVRQAGAVSVVALMGAVLSQAQQRLLIARFGQVCLMLDGDEAGRRATAILAARLRPHCSVRIVDVPAGTQPDQMTGQQIRDLLWSRIDRPKAVAAVQ